MGLIEVPGHYEKINGGGETTPEKFEANSQALFYAGTFHFAPYSS